MTDQNELVMRGAARLALFAATATLPGPPQHVRSSLLFHGQLMEFEDIVRHLSALPKPIELRLESEGGTTTLSTRAPTPRLRTPAGSALKFLDQARSKSDQDAIILCRIGRETIQVSLAEFREWESSYTLAGNYSVSTDLADSHYASVQGFAKGQLERALAVVVFGSPTHVPIPLMLTRALCALLGRSAIDDGF